MATRSESVGGDYLNAGLGGFIDSGLLFLSLTRSRQAWTTSLFKRPADSGIASDRAADEPVGSCTVVIGPHMFPDTRFFRLPCEPQPSSGQDAMALDDLAAASVPYRLAFEFRENPTDRWLLPEDAVVEALNMAPPYEVIATFCLPTMEGAAAAATTKPIGQQITMHFSEVSQTLWDDIRASAGDQHLAVQQLVKDIHFNLDDALGPIRIPYEQPRTLAEVSIIGRSSDAEHQYGGQLMLGMAHRVWQILHKRMEHDERISLYGTPTSGRLGGSMRMSASSAARKRAPEAKPADPRRSTKKARGTAASPKKTKRATNTASSTDEMGVASHVAGLAGDGAVSAGGAKKCMYCGCKSTPMWRRGPHGAGTLCNACGVKWKHGKILQGVTPGAGDAPSSSPAAAAAEDGVDRRALASAVRPKTPSSAATTQMTLAESPLGGTADVGSTGAFSSGHASAPLKKRFSTPTGEQSR
ncbi:hypothetical protein THASP1DRAFT_29624 [Thamnocephalis sphaerospora]|uniref:GATA-type domain-containing protein n=1 Tax=Thamnocephalis sphaerospora TaxID=78915 RepID=A0A4P9XR82_9FUNG|nr:hypothetical protein THASP1DRAFT_29624 [Thamnocephalis sphaerospora]|eukprot:RKP08576.1 hypothetical protein THASP1DRAFT_29624 [Thamnocephalis sphaerospora]